MADTEGIRSPIPTQQSARSPKLRIYESLFLWNHGVDHVVAILRGMEKFPFAEVVLARTHSGELACSRRGAGTTAPCRYSHDDEYLHACSSRRFERSKQQSSSSGAARAGSVSLMLP